MIYLLWLCMILIPYLYGRGFYGILCRNPEAQGYTPTDFLLTGGLIGVGLTELVHLCGVFGGISVSRCLRILGILFLATAALSLAVCGVRRVRVQTSYRQKSRDSAAVYIGFVAALVFLIEFILLQVGNQMYADGDMTLETVNTFLETDAFYSVNPLTGAAYTQGLPSRIKILCLPTLYSFLTKAFHMNSAVVIWRGVPAVVFLYGISAYKNLADALFSDSEKKRNLFLLLVAVIFLIGDYLYGVDGFLLLQSGFRAVTVRALVLLPYTVSSVLRKKWIPAVLCIIAEACITWTFYGAGACLLTAAGLTLASAAGRRRGNA